MTVSRHGISIGIERINDNIFLAFKVIGKLTHEDYATMTPILDSAIAGVKSPEVNAFVDLTEMEGFELRAAWDDFRLGLSHGSEFNKIALLGNRKWQAVSAKIGSWFIPGEFRYFEDQEQAFDWLQE